MKRYIAFTVAICAVFTIINFSRPVKADPPTILDYSTVTDGVITIGDSQCQIELDTNTHAATIKARSLNVIGIDTDGRQTATVIKTRHFAVGDVDTALYGEQFVTDSTAGTATVNSPGNTGP